MTQMTRNDTDFREIFFQIMLDASCGAATIASATIAIIAFRQLRQAATRSRCWKLEHHRGVTPADEADIYDLGVLD